jgi:hypothetical protein
MVSSSSQRGDTRSSAGSPPRGRFRAEHGIALVHACEALLQVEGPTALAGVSNRSKAWWSKLQCGKCARLPTLTEMEQEVLGEARLRALSPAPRAAWRQRYRDLWMQAHGQEDGPRLTVITAMYDPPLDQLRATHQLARRSRSCNCCAR